MNRKVLWGFAAGALVAIFLIDVLTHNLPYLQYLCVPVVLAAGLGGRRATEWLAALALVLSVAAVVVNEAWQQPTDWAYVLANAIVCGAAAWFAGRREDSERAAADAEADFQLALESTPVPTALLALDGRMSAVNAAMVELTGREREWLQQHELADLLVGESAHQRAGLHTELLSDPTGSRILDHRIRLADGREARVREHAAVMRTEDGRPRGFIIQLEDVTEDYAARRQLEDKALRDPLTGLLNRRGLVARLDSRPDSRRRSDRTFVLYLDLDGLKPVNDSLGHRAGDTLIRTVAQRISDAVRDDDAVARVGGDEFVVALAGITDPVAALQVAEKVRAAIAVPLHLAGQEVRPAASIGVAQGLAGIGASHLLERADRAMYRAKRAGGNRVEVHDGRTGDPAAPPRQLRSAAAVPEPPPG